MTWTATVEKRLVPLTDALNSVELINTIQRISTPTFAAAIFQTISLGDGVYVQNLLPVCSCHCRFSTGGNVVTGFYIWTEASVVTVANTNSATFVRHVW